MTGLIADIGGTNARLALIGDDGVLGPSADVACDAHEGVEELLRAFLDGMAGGVRPDRVALAVASPVTGDQIYLTNRDWGFSVAALRHRLGFSRLEVVNDFAAVALALPYLESGDMHPVGEGRADPTAPMVAIGPGTGLGLSVLVPGPGSRPVVLATEGGHSTLPAGSDREAEAIAVLRREFGHVSVERVVSGPGLTNLHRALGRLDGRADEADLNPAAITARAADGSCPLCREAVDIFCALLGEVAGNAALMVGARGGVFIAGGIVPRLGEVFPRSDFRARFEAKGRMSDYVKGIPTAVIVHGHPAFLGLAGLVRPE
ncbi:MAG: glucokinase [Magnetospirillum sp. WYHS-4]